jgi:hypothetical protein
MSAQPDRALMRAVAEVVIAEEKARGAADEVITADLSRLRERLDEQGTIAVPPALAEQVRAAARLLEQPPIDHPVARHLTGTMITRGGELAVSYSDGSNERLGSVVGPPGERGPVGASGAIGADGHQGPPGRDGISIIAAAINRDGELMLTMSDGTVLTPGRVVGRDAK